MKFFQDLPDLKAVPSVEGSKTCIGLIPLFDDLYFNSFFAYLKAAIYSRQSWILHTDASEQNVAIKLYIEDTLKFKAIRILEANGLTEDDVIWFNAPPLPDTRQGVWGRLGKKLCLYWDEQLSDYEKIVYWDADMFKLPEPEYRDFFARAIDEPYWSFVETVTAYRRHWRPQMIRNSVKNVHLGQIPIQDIFTRAGLGRVLQEVKGALTRPIGSLCVYPAAVFRSEYQDCLDWIRQHGPYIGDDEFVIGLAANKFVFYLNALHGGWGLTHRNVVDYFQGDTAHTCLHGKPITEHEERYTALLTTIGNSEPPMKPLYDRVTE